MVEQVEPSEVSCWRADSLGGVDAVTRHVDFDEITEQARALAVAGVTYDTLNLDDLPLGDLADVFADIDLELRERSGIVIVDGFPVDDPLVAELVLWRVAAVIGSPVSQSVMGERLGHVINMTDIDPHARAYRRNDELTPHTDPADVLTFLCLNPAVEGGESWFVSAMTLYRILRDQHPELLERHQRGWRYHRFGEQPDDHPPITPHRVPTFSTCDGVLSARYVRQYIEIAHDEDPDGCPLDDIDRQALDTLDRYGRDPNLALHFTLQAGQAVFANNYTVFHARTGFTDPPGHPKRHLIRLWLDAHQTRPVTPNTRIYPGSPGIDPQPGRKPSYATNTIII